MVSIQDREHGAILLKEIGKEPQGFLIHGATKVFKVRMELLVLFIERIELSHLKPLAREMLCQPSNFKTS